MTNDERLARQAARHEGVFVRAAAHATGVTDEQLDRQVKRGTVRRLAPGRFAFTAAPPGWEQDLEAAQAGVGPDGGLSHATAAGLWQLAGYDPGPVEVLVPVGLGSRNPLAVVHRSRTLVPADLSTLGPWRLTTPTRTLLDLARTESTPARFLMAFDDAVCRKLVSTERVARHAPRVMRRARRSAVDLLDRALAAWPSGSLAANVAEMEVVRLLLDAGFPQPELQVRVLDARGRFVGRVDVAYPWARLGIERQSRRWHGSAEARARDASRRAKIEGAGWTLVDVTSDEVAAGAANFLAVVHAHLAPFVARRRAS